MAEHLLGVIILIRRPEIGIWVYKRRAIITNHSVAVGIIRAAAVCACPVRSGLRTASTTSGNEEFIAKLAAVPRLTKISQELASQYRITLE